MEVCSVCGIAKSEDKFSIRRGVRTTKCKACESQRKRTWYQKNRTRINIDKKIARLKRYCEANDIKIKIEVFYGE